MKHLLMTMLIALLVVGLPACTKSEPAPETETADMAPDGESIVQPEAVYEDRAAADITTEADAQAELDRLTSDINNDTE
jgi:hypothetical protein